MTQKLVVLILSILVVLFWLTDDSDEEYESYNPNQVTVEYQCDQIDSYKHVPYEVIQECKSRGFSVRESI